MIAATMCVRDDADIVQHTVRNMLEQGIDRVYVYTSGAEAFTAIADLASPQVWATRNNEHQFHQTDLMNHLAQLAGVAGAEWIVPFDADEFWFTLSHGSTTVADTLRALPRTIGKVYATLWHHQTWDDKVVPAERLPKVAYRWHPDARVHMGNHDVDMPVGLDAIIGLVIRHFQFRSYEQFRQKVSTWCERLPADARTRGDVSHLTQYEGASDEQMVAAWRALCARPTVHDPIPYKR